MPIPDLPIYKCKYWEKVPFYLQFVVKIIELYCLPKIKRLNQYKITDSTFIYAFKNVFALIAKRIRYKIR